MNELLDSTSSMLAHKLGPDVRVVKDYDRGLPRIPGNPSELNQVWTNLIDNALTAMRDMGTGATLTLRTRQDGDDVMVEIGDTGPGVPGTIRDRIFDPFFTTNELVRDSG
ncbi:two-component system sensor kinase [Streptomyces hygroscopicus subsp. jinggangensis 5008]|nr:two-component system sensor kinase [Streptomyces hygroscopicus subsp. jinggangensis 5008]